MTNKKLPITRISKFYGSEDFNIEQDIGMEWLHGDMHFTLVLFRVDKKLSDVDDVYGEAGPEEIRYKSPVEFNAYVKIDAPQNKSYGNGLINQMEPGNMTLGVYIKHLEELGVDINYGDYIGYPEEAQQLEDAIARLYAEGKYLPRDQGGKTGTKGFCTEVHRLIFK